MEQLPRQHFLVIYREQQHTQHILIMSMLAQNGVSGTYKMMFCNGSGWQSTSNIMCDDDSSNGPRYIPTSHTLYCNTFSGSFYGTATYSNTNVLCYQFFK